MNFLFYELGGASSTAGVGLGMNAPMIKEWFAPMIKTPIKTPSLKRIIKEFKINYIKQINVFWFHSILFLKKWLYLLKHI